MTILVTGCAGFIGSKVASLLLNDDITVWGVDGPAETPTSALREWRLTRLLRNPRFNFQRMDITDIRLLKTLFRKVHARDPVSAVFNLAALAGVRGSVEAPNQYYEVNVLGTLNLLELCREFGVRKFILASTSSVYGEEADGPVSEDSPTDRPLSPYAASKKAAETLLYSYHHLHGIDAGALRYFTVYGPAGRPDMSVFRFIRNIVEGKPITVYGDGTQRRDFTYVDDIARGTVASLSTSGYKTINLGYGNPVALNDVIRIIEGATGQSAIIQYQERHQADPMVTWADIGLARDLLGWSPSVGVEDGVQRTADWYVENRDWAKTLT